MNANREKVIHAVETAFDVWIDEYTGCSWFKEDEVRQAKEDALALLKEQPKTKKVGGSIITTTETEKAYPIVCKAIVDSLIKNGILLIDKTWYPNGETFTWILKGVKHDAKP